VIDNLLRYKVKRATISSRVFFAASLATIREAEFLQYLSLLECNGSTRTVKFVGKLRRNILTCSSSDNLVKRD
jgi:hypothetical protein